MKHKFLKATAMLALTISLLMSTAAVLANSEPAAPEPPAISNLRLLKTEDGVPYFCLEVHIPRSVMSLHTASSDISSWRPRVWSIHGQLVVGRNGRPDVFINNPYLVQTLNTCIFEMKDMTESVTTKEAGFRLRFKYVYP